MKEFYLKFIQANSRMIKFLWSSQCDYMSDTNRLRKSSYYCNLNRQLFRELKSHLG